MEYVGRGDLVKENTENAEKHRIQTWKIKPKQKITTSKKEGHLRFLLSSHNVGSFLSLCPALLLIPTHHSAYVFSIGEIILKDTGENLLRNEEVKKAFLGG